MSEQREPGMRLRVLLPTEVLLERQVMKVIAEAYNGQFCLLPRHVDFVAALAPGILYYTPPGEAECFVAVDDGILVKQASQVLVSTLNAIPGTDLQELHAAVANTFRDLDDEERRARSTLARLEAGTMRRFLELERQRRG